MNGQNAGMGDSYDPAAYGETWAAVYDERHPDLAPDDAGVRFLAGLAGDGPVLEFAVGTGRVARPLAARGLEVHGIDASPAMLARLRGKEDARSIRVVEGDIATASADRHDFSLVFVVASSFFCLLDQDAQVACFANAARHLRPGGRFVIEGFVPDLARFSDDRHLSTRDVRDGTVLLEASAHDPLTQVVRSQHLTVTAAGVELMPVTVRYAWPAELDLMGRLAGLELEARHGGFRREPFEAWSPHHVSVYRRAGAAPR